VLAAHPGLRGVLVDQPHALEGSAEVFTRAGVADRCTVNAGDYTESVPRGDRYVLKNIVHGFDDVTAARILANCRRAMAPGGQILLVEFLIPPGNAPFPGKLMDLLMLVGSEGGRERTEPEFRSLCAEAGLELTDIETTRYAYSVLRAQ
ncbi:MAG TPA: methyltransferase, partial [Rugosimonospora sp.]|nr:methyltransferase [Rugosimonospora sp.]